MGEKERLTSRCLILVPLICSPEIATCLTLSIGTTQTVLAKYSLVHDLDTLEILNLECNEYDVCMHTAEQSLLRRRYPRQRRQRSCRFRISQY